MPTEARDSLVHFTVDKLPIHYGSGLVDPELTLEQFDEFVVAG